MSLENVSIQRDLLLSKDVSQSSVADIMQSIYNINFDDDAKEKEFKEFERKPIILHLNTYGGSCYDGWGLVNTIEHSKTPIYTICEGSAMSMGLPLLLAGNKRFIYKHSTVLYHELASWNWGKLTQIKEDAKQLDVLQGMYDDYVLEKTLITKEKLEDVRIHKIDWYMNAREALKNGVVDEII